MTTFEVEVKDYTPSIIRQHQINVSKALFAVGFFLEGEAKLRSPVDSGFLRGRNQFEVDLVSNIVELFNDAPYAEFVEIGTFKMVAQPFFRPAVEDNVDQITSIIENNLGE